MMTARPGKNGSSVVANSLRTANRPISNASPIVSKPATPTPTDFAPALLKKRSNREKHADRTAPPHTTRRGTSARGSRTKPTAGMMPAQPRKKAFAPTPSAQRPSSARSSACFRPTNPAMTPAR